LRSAIDIARLRGPRALVPIISIPAATVVIAAIAISQCTFFVIPEVNLLFHALPPPPNTIRAGIADRRRGLFVALGVFRLKARQDNPGPIL